MNKKRFFLVGCPRSGTTLLQSMLASHHQIISFPETRFFSRTLPINPLLRRLKLYGKGSRSIVEGYLEHNDYNIIDPFKERSSYHLLSHHKWCHQLINILDLMIEKHMPEHAEGNVVWGLEKSPRHLHYISSIDRGSKSKNKYIHLLRNGPDVVASLHLVTKKYPQQWEGERSVRKCIRWWNTDIRKSLKYHQQPNHKLVVYEQLLQEPSKVLKAICSFLNLEFQDSMVSNFHHTAGALKTEDDKWHGRNEDQSLDKSNKLETHFDDSTIKYIKSKTLDIDLKQFYH